jgi:hypothetical protein
MGEVRVLAAWEIDFFRFTAHLFQRFQGSGLSIAATMLKITATL